MSNTTKQTKWELTVTAAHPPAFGVCLPDGGDVIAEVDTEANARLIAAAPRMYEALTYVNRFLLQCTFLDDDGNKLLSDVQEALAAAEGKVSHEA